MTKPYKSYKPSRAGVLPSDWEVMPLKRVVSLKSGDAITSEDIEEEGRFPVFGGNGMRGYTHRYTHDGHFAIVGRQGALCGNVNYATGKFWASEHAVVASPVRPVQVRWLGELLTSLNLNQHSLSAAQPGLSVESISRLQVPVPPQEDQIAISLFLDRETTRIDSLVAKQQRLIKLLQEKRQAFITRAVTKGLDSAVPMEDSGVEWLGEVPAHWDICRLSRISTAWCDGPFGSAIASEHYTDEGALVVRLQNIKEGFYDDTDRAYLDHQYFADRLARHEVIPGDLLIAGLGDDNNPVGRSCVAPGELGPALVKADCFRFRVDANTVDAHYLAALLTSGSRWAAGSMSGGSTRSRIPLSKMAGRDIVLPPIAEQRQIVRSIETGKNAIDALLGKARAMIELMKEHRSALISAAVTGNIDVREAERAVTGKTDVREAA